MFSAARVPWPLEALALIFALWSMHRCVARALAHFAEERRGAVVWALSLVLMAAGPAVLGRWVGRLDLGLLILATLAAVLSFRLPPVALTLGSTPERTPRWVTAITGAFGFLVMITIWTSFQFDEEAGHVPLANVLFRNILPPEYPLFPGEPFRYHYGFDVLVALVRAAGLPIIRSIDLVTTACFALFLATAAEVGQALGGARARGLARVLVPMSSGTLLFLTFSGLGFGPLAPASVPIPDAWHDLWSDMVPPVISNFFQHPQGFGMPAALAILLLAEGGAPADRRSQLFRQVLVGLFLGAASLVHIVYFSLLGVALGASACLELISSRDLPRFLVRIGSLLGALVIAYGIGGFLTPTETHAGNFLLWGTSFFEDPFFSKLLRHLLVFGLPLMCLPLVIVLELQRPSPLRRTLLLLAILGFLVPNLVTYARSWDIVKFYGAGELFANLLFTELSALFLARFFAGRPPALRALAVASVVLVSTFSSWIWLLRHSVFDGHLEGIPRAQGKPRVKTGEAVRDFLGARLGPRDRVFSTDPELGLGGGILTPGLKREDLSFMIDLGRAARAADALDRARHDLGAEDLSLLEVRFLSLSPEDLEGLSAAGKQALSDAARFTALGSLTTSEGRVRHLYEVLGVERHK
ncbi:MAG: hypothetical protein U1E65_16090 [Myxococcota bacterium]